ncbi:glycosyltransferase family 39 protein [Candidatus Woesebacteria bacterium]|nr:glycosyltransferase family 39 protein [Candidatus Woesebacteria bacterium]
MKKFHHILALGLVIAIAFFLRFYNLSLLPYGFHNDEVMNGYVGRYILTNGTDLYGNRWPLFYFDNFGDYPNVIPMYLSGFSTYIFGVTEFGVRAPIAFFGILTVVLVYVMTRWLFKNRTAALLSAFTLAVLPWHIVLSRATAEGITASFVFLLGWYLVFLATKEKSMLKYGLAVGCLLATYLLYPSFRILVPLSSLAIHFLVTGKQWRTLAIGTTCLFFLCTFLITQTTWGRGRYEQTSVFTYNNEIPGRALMYATGLGDGHILEARIFHNKILLAGREALMQYFSYFSSQFLFGIAGKPPRYAVPEHGQAYYTLAAVLICTIAAQFIVPLNKREVGTIFKQGRTQYFAVLLFLLLISPLPAAVTLDDVPNIHRSILTGILLIFVLGFCYAYVLERSMLPRIKNIVVAFFILCISLEAVHFWHYYTKLSAFTSVLYRNEEQRSLALWLQENKSQYDQIFVPGKSLSALHYLFHAQDFRSSLAGTFGHGILTDSIDTIHFTDNDCSVAEVKINPIENRQPNIAVIMRDGCQFNHTEYTHIDSIKYVDLKTAYIILKYTPIPAKN